MNPTRRETMTSEHKAALAAGREASTAVRRYPQALETSKPKRGRHPSPEGLAKQLAEVESRIAVADPVKHLLLIQQRKDMEAKLNSPTHEAVDLAALEEAFIKVAAAYSSSKGLSYSTWREAGVPADVLRRAGISRSS